MELYKWSDSGGGISFECPFLHQKHSDGIYLYARSTEEVVSA